MSASEVIDRLAREAAHYRRFMWIDLVFGGLFAILTVACSLIGADAWATALTMTLSATMLSRAFVYRSVRRDLLDIVWYFHAKLAIGGLIARDVQ